MTRWFSPIVVVVLIAPIASTSGQQPSPPTVVQEDLRIRTPLAPCALPALALRVARSAHVPIGIEAVPETCEFGKTPPSDAANDIFLQGRSVTEALDLLVQLDPRYAWIESDGVVVVRPLAASSDPAHFLHRTIPSLNLVNQRLHGALEAIVRELTSMPLNGGDRYAATSRDGDRRFSLRLTTTSVVEALNASVRAHGAMTWAVRYCQPSARFEYATISFSTFDGSGLGMHTATVGENGKKLDACRAPQ